MKNLVNALLTATHIAATILTLFLVTCVGIYSLRKVKTEKDFSVGGRTIGSALITGTIVGTLVGGSSTIGTAQLAFQYGFNAWWFTLGAGIACLILGVFLAAPLRASGASTGPGFLALTYGERARFYATMFSSVGIFLNIIAQVLAAVALFTSILHTDPFFSAIVAVILIIGYVIFGGVWGTGYVGTIKVFLLYLSMFTAGLLALSLAGGVQGIKTLYPPFPWFSLFGRGVAKDLAGGFSLVVGVLSTQTCLQAIFSGRDMAASKLGALISAVIIPPIGLAGIIVGLYMRANFPAINASEALPLFILNYLPPWMGGISIAALLISIIGTGAGLVLGISTMLSQDLYRRLINPQASDRAVLFFSRLSIIVIALLTLFFVSGNLNSLILKWSMLSMGLRGAAICFPLLFAVFFRNRANPLAGTLATGIAPLCSILWAIWGPDSIDPLYPGLLASFSLLMSGVIVKPKAQQNHLAK